jgi:hypothetical protein
VREDQRLHLLEDIVVWAGGESVQENDKLGEEGGRAGERRREQVGREGEKFMTRHSRTQLPQIATCVLRQNPNHFVATLRNRRDCGELS